MTCAVFCADTVLPLDQPAPRRRQTSFSRSANCSFPIWTVTTNLTFAGGLGMALRSCKHLYCSPCVRRVVFVLFLAVVAFAVHASAQETNGRIIGTVTDSQGAAIAGAKITIKNVGT